MGCQKAPICPGRLSGRGSGTLAGKHLPKRIEVRREGCSNLQRLTCSVTCNPKASDIFVPQRQSSLLSLSTNKSPNRPSRHQISLRVSHTPEPRSSFPTRHESSTLIDPSSGSLENSLMAKIHAHRQAGEKLTNQPQRTSSAQHPAMTAD